MTTTGAPFEVTALGVGDTFSELHTTAALLLSCDGVRLAIDCPDRYRGVLRAASTHALARGGAAITLPEIDHMLITHVHGDHMNGLEGVAFFKHFAEGKRLKLVTSEDVRGVLWEQRLRAPMEQLWDGTKFRALSFDDYFDYAPLAWERAVEIGPFRITARKTVHHVPTSALLIEAGGRTLGYSADTAFDPTLIAWLAKADLVIHETNYGPAHTAYHDLLGVDAQVRERMRLIHYPDAFDVGTSAIQCLREGEVMRV